MDGKTTPFDTDHDALVEEMLRVFIVPNWYLPEHFEEMNGWSADKVNAFKNYVSKAICYHDHVKDIVRELIIGFEDCQIEEE
jgi:hypothetical protein